MIGPDWLGGVFALLSLAVTGLLGFAVVGRRGERAACLAHAAMALGTAGMFSPWGDPVPSATGAVAFAVIGSWFAARRLRRGESADPDDLHLVVGPAAMVVMYLGMDHQVTAGTPETSEHAGHGSALAAGGGGPVLAALLLTMAAYFVWHAWGTAALPGAGTTRPWPPLRIGHVVMSALMAVMLFGAL